MSDPDPRINAILDATLATVEQSGWAGLTMAAVASHSGITLADLYDRFPHRAALAAGLVRRLDRRVLADGPPEGATPRERLFDLLMRRFDALQPIRAGAAALANGLRRDPAGGFAALTQLHASLAWLIEAAGLTTGGLRGCLRVQAVRRAYAQAFRIWQSDDTPDLARTMAALDKRLASVERWLTPDVAAQQ